MNDRTQNRNDMDVDVMDDRTGAPGLARKGVLSAIFHDADDAEKAYQAAIERGYTKDDITVLMSEQARDEYYPSKRVDVEEHSKALEGTAVGGTVGATLGAIGAAIAAVGTVLAIPPLGLVVAGPLAAGLAGAGAGGIAGGLIGALAGAGMSEERARVYETAIKEGGVIMSVEPRRDKDASELAEAWEDCGGKEIYRG